MKIATWNVNSIRARHDLVIDWIRESTPDVLCIQETKVVDDDFPTDDFHRLGYTLAFAGQKTYNGVAIASRTPASNVHVGLADEAEPEDKRIISATVEGVRVLCVYVPNGRSVDSPSFPEKLAWLDRLRATVEKIENPRVAVCGDFNIAPEARDVYDPERFAGQLHFHPDEHAALARLLELGLTDAFRLHRSEGGHYSWWDYRAGAFRRNRGLRIDLILVSRALADRCDSVVIDRAPRKLPKPSDHTPVIATFH